MDMRRTDRSLSAAERCAIAGAIVIAIAGSAAPLYGRPGVGIWIAAPLLLAALAIVAALLWIRRRTARADEIAAPTLAVTVARSPLEAAPEELRTSPGVTLTSLIAAGVRAMRPATSNTEIGPAASRSWKSGKTRTAIIGTSRQYLVNVSKRGKYAISDAAWL